MKYILLPIFLFSTLIFNAQIPAYNFISANNIKTGMHSNGSLFMDENRQRPGFWNPHEPIEIASVFAGGLWLSAVDEESNLYVSQITYGDIGNDKNYLPGNTNVDNSERDYNQVWKVSKVEVDQLIADFQDGTVDDDPSPNILNWPGTDPMLPGEELAPFHDLNEDGIYNPLDGDYPSIVVNGMICIPDEMIYTVYHDDQTSRPDALGVDVHVIMYAFNSPNDQVLNNTIFTRFTVVNKSNIVYTDFRLGLWVDFDLGCFTDDYTGSDPERNSIYVYNQDEVDGEVGTSCPQGVFTYAGAPPVVRFTFLNHDLKSAMVYYNPSVGSPLSGTIDPFTPDHFFNLMNARWRDGVPLTSGLVGYNPGSQDSTAFAFDGNPSDMSGWTMNSGQFPLLDVRNIATVGTDNFSNRFTADIAGIFSPLVGTDHLENINISKADVDHIQDFYNQKFVVSTDNEIIDLKTKVFPNPTDGILNISEYDTFDHYTIMDRLGRTVQSGTITQSQIELDLHSGLYFIRLEAKNKTAFSHSKIVIK